MFILYRGVIHPIVSLVALSFYIFIKHPGRGFIKLQVSLPCFDSSLP